MRPLLAPLSDDAVPPLPELDPEVPSPAEVLGYSVGERFTPYHRIIDYLERLDTVSDRVALWRYGETYERRPLVLVAIGSAENISSLDSIRASRSRLADPSGVAEEERRRLVATSPTIVWLAYGVHGDEASSSEAAMAAAYVLAAGRGAEATSLDDVVVLVDPLANPDGRRRYLDSYRARRGHRPDPNPDAAEHVQEWPGGRGNHYLVDLNRDWTWVTQRETAARLSAYRRWSPQVYVDFHEMGEESTYFFPPPADPVHPAFARRAGHWLDVFGTANAAAFDRLGWTYYVGEQFDLFYPGYGDTYPILRGAVGMTYEMAGGGGAGSVVELPDGRTLSLADRVARHLTTSLATVATATDHRAEIVADFVAARTPTGPETTYVWSHEQPEAASLARLLGTHGIGVERLETAHIVDATTVADGGRREVTLPAGSYAVSTAQSLGTLADVLLARQAQMPEHFIERQRRRVEANRSAEFYDITAWSLPLAYNVETWVVSGALPGDRGPMSPPDHDGATASSSSRTSVEGHRGAQRRGRIGHLVPPQGIAGFRAAALLQRRRVPHRVALSELTLDGRRYGSGTIFVPHATAPPDIDALLDDLRLEHGVAIHPATTSRSDAGIPLGSERMMPVRPARVALLGGTGTEPTSFGFLWHLFDRHVALDHSVLDLDSWERFDLAEYDTLVLPGGDYGDRLDEEATTDIARWLDDGGTLVAIGGAIDWLQQAELVTFASRGVDEEDGEAQATGNDGAASAWEAQLSVPGAVVSTELAPRHPLTIGLPSPPPVLVRGADALEPSGDPRRDLVTAAGDPILAGFAWPEGVERVAGSLLVGTETHGDGRIVVFAHHPAFRLFWRGTVPLLLDAVLYGPSLR